MCNLYSMTATVDEMRRIFGPFEGDTTNLPPFDEIYPGHMAPVLRRNEQGGLELFHNQSSGVLTSAVWADGLVDNPPGRTIARGEMVSFIPLAEWLA